MFKLEDARAGATFSVCMGDGDTWQRRVRQVLAWRSQRQMEQSIGNKQVPGCINPDKNAKITRTEVGAKVARGISRHQHPSLGSAIPNKAEGPITST